MSGSISTGVAAVVVAMLAGAAHMTFRRTITSMASTTGVAVGWITCPNIDEGKSLAGEIVNAQLAACVNIVPGVMSVYKWEGEVQNDCT